MKALLIVLAVAYFAYSAFNIWRRPGVFAGLLFCGFGVGAILGPLGTAISIVAVLACAAMFVLKPPSGVSLAPSEVALVLWFAQTTLFGLWSPQMDLTTFYLLSLYGLGLSSYLFARTFATTPNFVPQAYWSTAFGMAICYMSLVTSAKTIGRLGMTSGSTGDALNSVGLSTLPEAGMILSFAILLFDREMRMPLKVVVLLVMAFVMVPFMISTGTRGVMVSVALVLGIYLVMYAYQNGLRSISRAIAIAAVGIPAGVVLFIAAAPTRLELTMAGGLYRIMGPHQAGASSVKERWDIFDQAIGLIKESPFLGYGPGSYSYMNDGIDAGSNYPHNLELELLMTGGLVGLTLFAWFVLPLVWHLIVDAFRKPISLEAAAILGLLVSQLFRLQLSFALASAKLFFFALGAAAALWAARRAAQRPDISAAPAALAPPEVMPHPGS